MEHSFDVVATDDCHPIAVKNVALGKPAVQVHQWEHYGPELAVDGNKNTDFGVGHCSTTSHGPMPWWSVDLLQTYCIGSVTITNRGDQGK